jgi:hypothetical protein
VDADEAVFSVHQDDHEVLAVDLAQKLPQQVSDILGASELRRGVRMAVSRTSCTR